MCTFQIQIAYWGHCMYRITALQYCTRALVLPRMPVRSSGVWQVSEQQLSSLRAMRHDDARETWLGRGLG